MSRPSEQAQNALNRFVRAQRESILGTRLSGRPRHTRECLNVSDAHQYRHQVISTLEDLILRIESSSLETDQVRALSAEINALSRERWRWEYRISDLGGPRYPHQPLAGARGEPPFFSDGKFYYGAARKLPEVAALVADAEQRRQLRSKEELLRRAGPSYFGLHDEAVEAALLQAEQAASQKLHLPVGLEEE
jgi:pre-mRNA-splicing factor ISY1